MRDPPQKWAPASWSDTCHGDWAVDVASSPPMIRELGGALWTVTIEKYYNDEINEV